MPLTLAASSDPTACMIFSMPLLVVLVLIFLTTIVGLFRTMLASRWLTRAAKLPPLARDAELDRLLSASRATVVLAVIAVLIGVYGQFAQYIAALNTTVALGANLCPPDVVDGLRTSSRELLAACAVSIFGLLSGWLTGWSLGVKRDAALRG
jgi:hypothetical protein